LKNQVAVMSEYLYNLHILPQIHKHAYNYALVSQFDPINRRKSI